MNLRKTGKFALILLIGAFIISGLASEGIKAQDSITLADASWDSIQVHNRIAGFIIEHGYGYEVSYEFGDTIPLLLGLRRGDVDVYLEVWIENMEEAYLEALENGEVIDLGQNFPDSPQGWYVPTYMIEGDEERGIDPVAPGLQSVKDLPDYWELFEEREVPGKGRFYNAPPGWVAHDINLDKFDAYGLHETFDPFSPGSDTALATAIVRAYERGEPIVAYYWEPTWVVGLMDLTRLEEPEFDEEVWEENHGCEYPASRVHISINPELVEKAPEIVSFVGNYDTTLEQTNEALALMFEEDASTEEAAIWFLDNYRQEWQEWIFHDHIVEKVEKALEEELD